MSTKKATKKVRRRGSRDKVQKLMFRSNSLTACLLRLTKKKILLPNQRPEHCESKE